jgi:hypothetical protein
LTLEAITNRTAIIAQKISTRLVFPIEPKLLVFLQQTTVIEKLAIDHGEAPGIDKNVTPTRRRKFWERLDIGVVALWMNHDRERERIPFNPIRTGFNLNDTSAVILDEPILIFGRSIDHLNHAVDKLRVSQHELIDED